MDRELKRTLGFVPRMANDLETSIRLSLSFLSKNDPVYSLCVADMMAAPQSVHNQFIKDQRALLENLRRLEYQKLTKMRQLNEERQHFALLMKRKLAPRVNRWASPPHSHCPPKKPLRATYSSVNISAPTGSKGTRTEHLIKCPSDVKSEVANNKAKFLKVSHAHFTTTVPKNICTCSHKKLLKRASSLPDLRFAISDFDL
ncbi:uncharacterized protein [Heterodontus francisci]|uniref:uncharacterized protein n=1 Tax=Heterodontus francisci TaxID=7792 RepID=UPI00355B4B6A